MPSKRPSSGSDGAGRRLDELDRRLLDALGRDGRLTPTELATRVGLSRPAVGERIRRLEREGVIRGWHADLDPAALGLPFTVVIRIRPSGGQARAIEALLRATSAVVEGYRTTGDEAYLVKACFATVPDFEAFLASLNRHGEASAADVLSAVVPPRPPPL